MKFLKYIMIGQAWLEYWSSASSVYVTEFRKKNWNI